MSLPEVLGRQKLLLGLADQARCGDRNAFEQLVAETSAEIYSLAFRLVGNEHDARDVTQDAYLRAFRAISKFRGESSVSTWLYRITANCAATQLRRRTTVSIDTHETDVVDDRVENLPEEMLSRGDDRKSIVGALRQLPATSRVVVVLHDIYDLTHEEIAKELRITKSASKVRLHRARRQLREMLGEEYGRDRKKSSTHVVADVVTLTTRTKNTTARESEVGRVDVG